MSPPNLARPGDAEKGPRRSRAPWVEVVAIPLAFVLAAAGCAVVWEWIWDAPAGVALEHKWTLDGSGLTADFSGTGLYVVIAAVAGIVLGVVLSLAFERDELVTLALVVVGSALAAWVMAWVGHQLGPADPRELARTAEDFKAIPSDLQVEGFSPYLAFPAGALTGAVVVLFGLTKRS